MSRLAKWKLEKAKVKVVFRLQFHATHVPQVGWDKLFISFIPSDSVKATAKTTKALVRNGTCKWGDPIYETTRLLLDTRTKQYDEKLYKIIVAMGTSRSSILGEAMINLAEYADALKPFAIVLPLQGSDSGAILHVTVQLLTSKTGFREFEQQRELRERGPSTTPEKFRDYPLVEEEACGLNRSDSNTSGSLTAEKHEIESLKSTVSGDLTSLTHTLEHKEKNMEEENIKLRGLLQDMEASINEIKTEVSSLQCYADDIGSKAQDFSQILISEIGSGDKLDREVSLLKSECLKLKQEVERLSKVKTHALYNNHNKEDQDSVSAMRDKIAELARGLDESKAENDSLAKKMDQMECYYESLVQELEETQRQLLVEFQNLRTEHFGAKAEIDEQRMRFTEEKKAMDSLNEELEKRALASEAALKRARLNYSIAVNHLQKDLELLSSQVVSMYETNENLIKQLTDDSKPERKEKKEGSLKGDVLVEDLKRSLHVQEGLYRKVEEELYEMHSRNLYLEVFSKILHETFVEATVDVKTMKEQIVELGWKLELSTEAKEILKQRLDIALDEICSLNDVALQNQSLEENLKNITYENFVLLQRIDELEPLVLELKNCKTNYETCVSEKKELIELMEKEVLEKNHIQANRASLQAEFDDVRGKFDDLVTENGTLQKNFNSLKDKLMNTLDCCNEKLILLPSWEEGVNLDVESRDLAEQLDKFLCKICEKSSELVTENQNLIQEKSKTEFDLRAAAETDIIELKQKHENDLKCLVTKLEASTALLQKLEASTAITKAEQNYESSCIDFLSRIDCFEKEMGLLVAENETLGQEISRLSSVAIEHERTKLLVEELTEEKKVFLLTLQDKSQEISGLVCELGTLRTKFEHELSFERSSRKELEIKIQDLTSELVVKSSKLLSFDEQSSELVRLESSCIEELLQCLIVEDVQLVFTKHQSETCINDLAEQLSYFSKKHNDVESNLNHCLVNEKRYIEENNQLLISLDLLKCELDSYIAKSKSLTDMNNEMSLELEKYKAKDENAESSYLERSLFAHEDEIEKLTLLNAEAEITVWILKDKLAEQCGDFAQKLSEQILKTEEFKSLSIHLKELKDKAEEECEKTNFQAPLTPQQESLRIIFIKEQYETKLHELQHQLTMSKKHGEEILMKLQDTIDENEAMRKAESTHLKRIKEMGDKISELEAKLDCSLLSLECCKEDKQKLEAFLYECKEKRSKSEETMSLDKSEETLVNSNLRAETLRSSLDHLNNELERMKNENLLQPQDDNDSDSRFPGLEQELIQLRKAKEELQSIFPLYQENFSCGNALERVLALEIELAEALRGKKNSTIHLQSSFLKQHTGDEAIFQSFRDINNLIEEMLETKGRYASVETELKEMHEHYSQLSLKFAEVEGERQKLMMTLKNVRASKKASMLLNRSSSTTLGEH